MLSSRRLLSAGESKKGDRWCDDSAYGGTIKSVLIFGYAQLLLGESGYLSDVCFVL